jgi:hypothetical protein
MAQYLRDISKQQWADGDNPTVERINAGSLQRIADAAELMAKNHTELVRERDSERLQAEFWKGRAGASGRSIVALRGVITKLKRRINDAILEGRL